MTTRVYRTLLLLYPKPFRLAYGEDMVAVFEEMQRDHSAAALWWRVVSDAFKSVIVQRLETVMSKGSMLRPVAFAAFALVALITVSARGVNNLAAFLVSILITGGAVVAALVYWQANRAYTEPTDQVHRYWWHTLGAGAALIGVANLGTGLDIEAPWLLLFSTIIAGIMLIAMGVILAIWHAMDRKRPASA